MSKLPKIEEMLEAGMHFGHATQRWHPKMKPYIFGARKGVYIIDLSKTQKSLENALAFMENLVRESKTILFVGTKNQVKKITKEMAQNIEMPYVSEKWLGGLLTNFTVFKKMIKKYKDLLEEKKLGKLDRYTKKERLDLDKEMERLEKKVGGLVNLHKIPDALFVWDIKTERTAVAEAKSKNVPIIAVCDTNVNPSIINYPIPANDDATKGANLILNCIKENILAVKKDSKPLVK